MPSFILEIGWFGFGHRRRDRPPIRFWMLGPVLVIVSSESFEDREARYDGLFRAERSMRRRAECSRDLYKQALDIAKESALAETPAPTPSPPGDPARPGFCGAFLDVSSLTLPPPAPELRAGGGLFPGLASNPQTQETDE